MHKVVQLRKHKRASHLACICRSFRLRTRWGWRRYLTSGLARSKVSQCTYLRSLNQVWIVHRRSASGGCSTGRRKALSLGTQQTPRKVDASFFQPWLLGTMRQCSLFTKCCWFMCAYEFIFWFYPRACWRRRQRGGGNGNSIPACLVPTPRAPPGERVGSGDETRYLHQPACAVKILPLFINCFLHNAELWKSSKQWRSPCAPKCFISPQVRHKA